MAMALVGVAGGGAYVAVSGGSTPVAAPVAPAAAAATEPAPVETSEPAAASSDASVSDDQLPPDLALTDPLTTDDGGDELAIEAPIQPITVVDEGDPTDPSSGAPASAPVGAPAPAPSSLPTGGSAPVTTTLPSAETTLPAAVVIPVAAGRFEVGSCVKVAGTVNDRTRRVSDASVTQTDCAQAHNGEIVSLFDPAKDCERSVVSFVGYPEQITKVEGTAVAFSIVQDKSDSLIYCVANFPTMPDYTGQLFQSKVPQ